MIDQLGRGEPVTPAPIDAPASPIPAQTLTKIASREDTYESVGVGVIQTVNTNTVISNDPNVMKGLAALEA
jgi:hypothetical protein